MPTVILLDTSLSMRRPASKNDQEETRHSLACKGLEWFFDYLSKSFPHEYTSLHAFSSGCETLAAFTRDYKELKSKLAGIAFYDRTDLHSALATVVEVVVAEWGAFAPCQVVVVTDGSPGVKHQDTAHRKQALSMPFSCQLSVLCIATREELMLSAFSRSNMERLCETADIAPSDVFVPGGALTVDSIRSTFKELAKACFLPFVSTLKCGHLQSQISLSPSPAMHRSNYDIVINAEHKFTKLDTSLGNLQFPKEMDVCGFLDCSSVPAPPHYSRHFVLDPEVVEKKAVEQTILSPTEEKPVALADEAQRPSFRVLLHGSLKCESKSALVKLGEKWYGLMFSQTSTSKKANLVLCVLYPNSDLPWLGRMVYLGPKTTDVTDPRMVPNASETNPFPVEPSHLPSFHTPSNLLWAKEGILQTDVSKVIRYSRKLPDKEASLIKELNKLRLVALTYCMPELLEVICFILNKEDSATSNPNTRTLLQQCVYFLTNNKNPQDRLVIKSPG